MVRSLFHFLLVDTKPSKEEIVPTHPMVNLDLVRLSLVLRVQFVHVTSRNHQY